MEWIPENTVIPPAKENNRTERKAHKLLTWGM